VYLPRTQQFIGVLLNLVFPEEQTKRFSRIGIKKKKSGRKEKLQYTNTYTVIIIIISLGESFSRKKCARSSDTVDSG
jgi:hypothetical protein